MLGRGIVRGHPHALLRANSAASKAVIEGRIEGRIDRFSADRRRCAVAWHRACLALLLATTELTLRNPSSDAASIHAQILRRQ
jgi:hypothetical protein